MSLEIHDVARIKGLLRLPVLTIVGLHVTSWRQCRWPRAKAFLSLVSSAFGRRIEDPRRTREKTSGTQGTPLETKLYFHVPYLFD